MKKLLKLLSMLLILSMSAYSQKPVDTKNLNSIDSLLSKKYKLGEPGLAILVAKKGKIVYRKAFGNANLELNVPMQPEMLFNLASITKQFTAVAILQLMEAGKLSLQDSVQKFIKDFPSKSHPISIEQLLTHTAGLKDYLQIDYGQPFMERRDFSAVEMIKLIRDLPLEFEPGTKYSYSNTGYLLLGRIIELASGKSYSQYVKDQLFNPAGMSATYYDSPNSILTGRTNGYKKNSVFEKADYWSASLPYAAGGLVSNVDDLFKWHQALLSSRLISKETLQKASTPFKLKNGAFINYGYGWTLNNLNGIHTIEHGGSITGYRTHEVYYPDQDVFIAILSNCECTPVYQLIIDVSGFALGRKIQPELKINKIILEDYVGTYQLKENPKRTFLIKMDKDSLFAVATDGRSYRLLFQTNSSFQFNGIIDAKGEFIKEEGKVTKFLITQNGTFEWLKVK
jgi:CubicO group peptidase (beta-lactamase class C family)